MIINKTGVFVYDFEAVRGIVKALVKETRYDHTLGVESEAVRLAVIFGLSEDERCDVAAAAILHDITKDFTVDAHMEVAKEYGITLTEDDLDAPKSLHGITGAHIAKREFNANDTIYESILYHTLGSTGYFPLAAKIIYLADYIEPNRIYEDCVFVRDMFYDEVKRCVSFESRMNLLNRVIVHAFNLTIKEVIDKNMCIHPDGVICRNRLLHSLG
ncbi:hydrolase [Clostridia bacterium]|nr:hydrolase [Clostridia bacterium]